MKFFKVKIDELAADLKVGFLRELVGETDEEESGDVRRHTLPSLVLYLIYIHSVSTVLFCISLLIANCIHISKQENGM